MGMMAGKEVLGAGARSLATSVASGLGEEAMASAGGMALGALAEGGLNPIMDIGAAIGGIVGLIEGSKHNEPSAPKPVQMPGVSYQEGA
jgi:hypothetical protein